MPEVASQTLDFVGRELNVTLAEARTALENYVEQPDNVSLLERCTLELHQVQGVLRVLEIYGAALLAEEMEQVASYLLQTASERKSQAESLDALMRAMVQLPSYLERVLAGVNADNPTWGDFCDIADAETGEGGDDEEEDDDLIEDASDLGEDDDDMAEVIEHLDEGEDEI